MTRTKTDSRYILRMSLQKNTIANYVGTGATTLAPILALPWYLTFLGPQQFGLLGFVTMLQAVLNIVDAGMGQALVRELSLVYPGDSPIKTRTAALLRGFERFYWAISLTLGCAMLLLVNVIATDWLHLDATVLPMGRVAVSGAVLLFIVQFPGSLYRSVLIGSEHQITLNKIMLLSAVARHGGGVLMVMQWPSLTVYLAWQIGISLMDTMARGRFAWKATGCRRRNTVWEMAAIKNSWATMAGLTAASGLGALTTQLDKVFLSSAVPLADFGYYTIAASLAGGVLQLVYPFMQAALPQIIRFRNDAPVLRNLFAKMFYAITFIATAGLTAYFIFGHWLLQQWLRDTHAANQVYPLLGVLLIGAILNAFYNIGYAHWIALGRSTRILQVNLLACALCLLIIPLSVAQFGTIGATVSWLIINLLGLALSLPGVLATMHEK